MIRKQKIINIYSFQKKIFHKNIIKIMNNKFCFSVLALSEKYQLLAKELANTIEKYAPGVSVFIGTDNPNFFQDCQNVFAFKLYKKGILHCYHDKRFVIEKALTKFKVAVQIDADTKIIGPIPQSIHESTELAGVHVENLVEHVQKYNPERMYYIRKLADKLEISLDMVSYIGESLFSVSAEADKNKISEFIKQWGSSARYLELHGIHSGQGIAMGLAAAQMGIKISQPSWLESINKVKCHLDASGWKSHPTLWKSFTKRADYHFRLNQARVIALKDFKFYYL